MKRREMKLLLEERFERIALLETRIDTMDQLVEGFRSREQAILDTLQSAKETAEKTAAQANAEAKKTRDNAMREANTLLADAAAASDALRAEAERRAKEIMITAKAESDRMLRDAEIIKREYEEMVELFNAMLDHNASELQTSAERFAEFVKSSKIEPVEKSSDGEAFYKSVGALSDVSLPDPSGDPALLMRNIYRIQNRPMPDEKPVRATEEPDTGARQAEEEPFSEAAWANEAQQSPTEPQAEFTKAFDGAYNESAFVVRADGCHLTQSQAEHMFGALFTAQELSADAADAKTAPESAEIPDAPASKESADEAALAFDALYDASLEPSAANAQDEAPQTQAEAPDGAAPEADAEETAAPETETNAGVTSAEAVSAFDDFFTMQADPASAATLRTELDATPAPEPYSEAAWADSAFVADHEPQAEGNLFSSETEADSETEPADAGVSADTQRAIDDLLAGLGVTAALTQTDLTEPPTSYSEAALEGSAVTDGQEPQEEGSFSSNDEAEPASEPAQADAGASMDTQSEIEDLLKSLGVTTEPDQPDSAEQTAPYSEAAWANDALPSDREAQAEFSPAFAAEPAANETPQTQGVSETDAERAFDDFIKSRVEPFAPAADAAEAATPAQAQPEAYSEEAWARESLPSDLEPQAEGTLFVSEHEPAPASFELSQEDAAAQMREIDNLLAGCELPVTPAAETVQPESTAEPAAEPAPYSEAAWAQDSFTGGHEPQAEDALISEDEPEQEEPAPRRYNEFGELREWEPEPEPDIGDMPTVSRYMGESGIDEEISLDALLDEIIKAGE